MKSIMAAIGWLIPSRLFYTVSQWVMLMAVARITDLATVGAYGLALGITTLVFRLLEFGMSQSANIDHNQDTSDEDYIFLRNALSVIGIIICCVTGLVVFRGQLVGLLIATMSISKAVETQTTLTYAFFRRSDRVDYMAQSLVLRGLLGALSFVGILYTTGSLIWALFGLAASWLCVAFLLDHRRLQIGFWTKSDPVSPAQIFTTYVKRLRSSHELALQLMPLAIAGAAAYGTGVIPRVMLEAYSSSDMVGIFTAIFYPLQAGSLILLSLNQVFLGPMSSALQKGKIIRGLKMFILLSALIGVSCIFGLLFIVFAGKPFLKLAYGFEYAFYDDQLLFLALAWIPRYFGSAFKAITVSLRMFKETLWSNVAMFSVTGVASIYFIPHLGLNEAIWTVSIGHITFFVISALTATLALVQARKRMRPT